VPYHLLQTTYRFCIARFTVHLQFNCHPTQIQSLFTLFLTEAHFETIAADTNRYAEVKKAGSEGKRPWWPTSAAEIKIFVAVGAYG
jgi:hypothetical protein